MSGSSMETIVVDAVLDYWRRHLPAKCTALNALRKAKLKSALAEPFTIPVDAVLRVSAASQGAAPTDIPLTAGTRSAAELVADFGAASVPDMTATAEDGRFVLISDDAPAAGAPSVIIVARDTDGTQATGANAALGWSEGGEHFEMGAIVSPNWRGVVDGRPKTAPDMGQGFWVMLGPRTCKPTRPGARWHLHNVSMAVEVWRPFSANAPPHRSREAISSCVRACRELILTTDGRYLGRQANGDIQFADVTEAVISGDPMSLQEVPGALFDTARFTLNVRVFQRPE